MSSHGPHFDEFRSTSSHTHGGSEFDEFGERRPAANAGAAGTGETGNLHDHTQTSALHGARWDEFGWREMPVGHGHSFDSNFRAEHALDGGDHGTWHDVFRGGTQVRYIKDGCDYEGTVLNAGDDHLIVRPNSGGPNGGGIDHELGLQQLRAFRHTESQGTARESRKPAAHVETGDGVAPASTAHAPSAHNAKARGGGRTTIDPDAAALTETKVANKTSDPVDVAKTLSELRTLAAE